MLLQCWVNLSCNGLHFTQAMGSFKEKNWSSNCKVLLFNFAYYSKITRFIFFFFLKYSLLFNLSLSVLLFCLFQTRTLSLYPLYSQVVFCKFLSICPWFCPSYDLFQLLKSFYPMFRTFFLESVKGYIFDSLSASNFNLEICYLDSSTLSYFIVLCFIIIAIFGCLKLL